MAEAFIRKIQPDQDGLDFEGLRKEGLRIIQEVSGDIWTDYNLHDPGVTILEALCYALTDLTYRAGFDAADYLASEDGSIDFRRQVLYRPDEILPCHPVTGNDYRKLILSAVPNIDNVWLCPDEEGRSGRQGLYRIYVQLSERVQDQDNEGVRKAYADVIRKVYVANRNLCEDLAGIEIVERIPYSLCGEIEIDGKREPANILAEIYYECAQYLSPRVPIHSYSEKYKEGKSLEELYTGVLTGHGYIDEAELYPWRGHFSIPDLTGRIARIEGVKNINHLIFVDADGREAETINLGNELSYRAVACLRLSPLDGEAAGMRLFKAGKTYPVMQLDVEQEFRRLDYKHQVSRQRKHRFDLVETTLPGATFRKTSEYYSLQNHFPDIYGLNAYGVPDSAPPQRKAQAAQLKAYLLFFEQLLANFLQNLQGIPRLFSLDEQLQQSCFHQVMRNDVVPGVEQLYLDGVAGMDSRLAALMAAFDNYGNRRNRVLDYLLAIYGERFSQNSLRHFFREEANSDEERIANKIAFLQDIADVGKRRPAAFDYRKPMDVQGNVSGLKKKLRLLLGLRTEDGEDFQIVEHILLRAGGESNQVWQGEPGDFYNSRLSVVFPADSARFCSREFRKLAEETIYLNCPAHIHPEIFWLDRGRMGRFRSLQQSWLEVKRTAGEGGGADEAAWLLLLFLLEIRLEGERA